MAGPGKTGSAAPPLKGDTGLRVAPLVTPYMIDYIIEELQGCLPEFL